MEMKEIMYLVLTVGIPLVLRLAYLLVSEKVSGTRYAEAVTAVYDAVDYINQTFVDTLKAQDEFNEEAASTALEEAKTIALQLMEAKTFSWLESAYDNLDDWLEYQIEAAVKNRKAGGSVE